MSEHYDVVVIGGGPAGYVAALRCAQLGLQTACVDAWVNGDGRPALGGTCLNVGCIPSKSLLESSEYFVQAQHDLLDHGIDISGVALDLPRMQQRKQRVVRELTQGIEQLFKASRIDWVQGRGQLLAGKRVRVSAANGDSRELAADSIVLAPGSVPAQLEQLAVDGDAVVDSSGALEFDRVPRRLGVIGAGAIGLELGSVWRRLGSERVTVLEAQDEFLAMVDRQVAREAQRLFARQGLDIQLGCRVVDSRAGNDGVEVEYQNADGKRTAVFDKVIVAVGRRPNTETIAADEATLLLDEWGLIHVDDRCCTNLPGVYAIGDAVRGPMLAHKGSEEGVMVAELIAGKAARMRYDTVPSVIYTLPEIAWVGQTEQALKAADVDYRVGVFPFAASGRARATGQTDGFIKLLADSATDRILGTHMIGPHCSELIAEAVITMELGGSAEDLALTTFAHPSLSESLHEAALAVEGRALHIAQRRRPPRH
ncbi:MAG: dihydrolipoyl dehydrogenase [Thiogranum sp.]